MCKLAILTDSSCRQPLVGWRVAVRYNPLLEAHLLSLLEKADLRGKTGECASKANLQHPS